MDLTSECPVGHSGRTRRVARTQWLTFLVLAGDVDHQNPTRLAGGHPEVQVAGRAPAVGPELPRVSMGDPYPGP